MRTTLLTSLAASPLLLLTACTSTFCWDTGTCPYDDSGSDGAIIDAAARDLDADATATGANPTSVVLPLEPRDAGLDASALDGSDSLGAADASVEVSATDAELPAADSSVTTATSASATGDAGLGAEAQPDGGPQPAACDTQSGRACTAECPCGLGEGVCTADDQCSGTNTCVPNGGAKYGWGGATCLPAHCNNDATDTAEGETSVDCGGECGCLAEIVSVPWPSGFEDVTIADISGDGTVVVGQLFGTDSSRRAFMWRIGDPDVTILSPAADGYATATSRDGLVIGGIIDVCSGTECLSRGVTWRAPDWSAVEVSAAPDDTSAVYDLSASGAVIVGLTSNTGHSYGHFWSATRSGSLDGSAIRISADGKIVAVQGSPFLLHSIPTDTDVEIAPLDGFTTGISIFGLSADGRVVVGQNTKSFTSTGASNTRGLIWTRELGSAELLGTQALLGVSDDGTTVVARAVSDDLGQYLAFWDSTRGLRSALTDLAYRGMELPDDTQFNRVSAGISGNGKTVYSGDKLIRLK